MYFAYGSNMLRARLEERVGPAHSLGPWRLADYRHAFTKLGRDGSGKGNIEPAPGSVVYGVLYRLDSAQLAALAGFEGGYRQMSVTVQHLTDNRSQQARTFIAERPVAPQAPTARYVAYYADGMLEHDLPPEYRRAVLEDARALMARGAPEQ